MDLAEVLLLSSDDEMVFYPDQNFFDESDELSRAFFNPEDILHALEESLDLEEELEGIHHHLSLLASRNYNTRIA